MSEKVNTNHGRTIMGAILYVILNCLAIFWGIVVFNDLPGPYHPYMTFTVVMLAFAGVSSVYAAAPTILYGWDR